MRTILATALVALACVVGRAQSDPDPWPKSVEEFRLAVQKVLSDTGVPGAGLALVRSSGVEWAGGVGLADRDARTPVTADTHFRAGSISKTFIASTIVQLYLDGLIELDAPLAQIAPEIAIDNAWEITSPVRVIHLLQHTAGFDDMHFNEIYNRSGQPEMPLDAVLGLNPASRVVRWRPGTRMSYSNPGYAIAGYLIEKITGESYEDRIAEHIFKPSGMPTSSFRLTDADVPLLAKGYRDRSGPPVPFTPIYLRPAGNLHTSPLELGNFVHVLLNWGETEKDLVIDPEYLSNMEHPRSTLASDAGLRNGYGSGIASSSIEGFPMLGHGGGIDGFISNYAYSTSRDIGFVVLLNSTHSSEALQRISTLAVRYLKADVEPPAKPKASVAVATLNSYAGYYHDASPRNQAMAFISWLMAGESITVSGDRLQRTPVFGDPQMLTPVSDSLFRFDADPEASRVFTRDADGRMIFAGGSSYSEQRSRLGVEMIRVPVLVSAVLVVTPLLVTFVWIAVSVSRRNAGHGGGLGFWALRLFVLLCAIAFVLPIIGILNVGDDGLGTPNVWTYAIFAGTVLLPIAAIAAFMLTIDAWRRGARRGLRAYALAVSLAALVLSGYLSSWGMIGFRPWSF